MLACSEKDPNTFKLAATGRDLSLLQTRYMSMQVNEITRSGGAYYSYCGRLHMHISLTAAIQ